MPLHYLLRGASRVVKEKLLLLRGHFAEEIARLLPVILLQPVVIVVGVAFKRKWQVSVFRLVVPQSLAVRVVSRRRSEVSICPHLAIAVIEVELALRRIHWDVIEGNTEAVSLGISIREQPALEHFVRREANTRNHTR